MYKVIFRPYSPISVAVVGCGGTGAFVADGLCRILPKNAEITLIDPDMVEERNLGRQLFSYREVGKPKAEALGLRLAGFYNRRIGYSVSTFDGWPRDGRRPTIAIGCVDNALARMELNRRCQGTWYIDAGNDYNSGQVFIGNTSGENAKHAFGPDFFTKLPLPATQCPELLLPSVKPQRPCAEALAMDEQSPVINQMMASLTLLFVHKLLLSELSWMAAYIDLVTGTLTPVQAEPRRVAKILGFKVDSLLVKPEKKEV